LIGMPWGKYVKRKLSSIPSETQLKYAAEMNYKL
jgi:uncharacterized protein (DUF3820 family)